MRDHIKNQPRHEKIHDRPQHKKLEKRSGWCVGGIIRNQNHRRQHDQRYQETNFRYLTTVNGKETAYCQISCNGRKHRIAAAWNLEVIANRAEDRSDREGGEENCDSMAMKHLEGAGPNKVKLLLNAERPKVSNHPRRTGVVVYEIQKHGSDVDPSKLVPVHDCGK